MASVGQETLIGSQSHNGYCMEDAKSRYYSWTIFFEEKAEQLKLSCNSSSVSLCIMILLWCNDGDGDGASRRHRFVVFVCGGDKHYIHYCAWRHIIDNLKKYLKLMFRISCIGISNLAPSLRIIQCPFPRLGGGREERRRSTISTDNAEAYKRRTSY
jgi:hypothetical protein